MNNLDYQHLDKLAQLLGQKPLSVLPSLMTSVSDLDQTHLDQNKARADALLRSVLDYLPQNPTYVRTSNIKRVN